jgi:hypothetical protein
MGELMPIYRLGKEDRCRVLNITPEVHDRAQLLIAERFNAYCVPEHGDAQDDPRCHLSWYEACRIVDPETDHGKYHFLIDNGHGDGGDWHTMSFSRNVARMLEMDLGIRPEFVHNVHHRPELDA